MADIELDHRLRQIQSEYLDFLDDDSDQGLYSGAVKKMIKTNECRIIVDINDLRRKLPERTAHLLNNSVEEIIAFQRALKEYVTKTNTDFSKKHSEFFVGFEGSKHVSPRTLLQVKRRLDWDTSSQTNVSTIKFAPKVIFKAPSLPTKVRPVVASFVVPNTALMATTPPSKPIVTKLTIQSPQIRTEESATPSKGKHRYETSLGQLTRKFISLFQSASDGILNLNEASNVLQVQKRRIYDITNVLEGVGLLHKTSKNNIQWKGGSIDGGPDEPSSSAAFQSESVIAKKIKMEMENARLDAKERELNELIEMANNELRAAHDNPDNKRFAYVTYRDIRGVREFSDQTVIAIKAPSETKLEVPDPRESLQIWLKSERGEIEVYLCPEDDGNPLNSDEGKGESLHSDLMSTNGDNQENDGSKAQETALKFAFISEADDLGPMGSKSFLMQTEDQLKFANETALTSSDSTSNLQFLHLEPPLSEDDYNFTLEESEGIADLFDDDFSLS